MGARRHILNIPNMKTFFLWFQIQLRTQGKVESIKDWNIIIDKIHFTADDFMKC